MPYTAEISRTIRPASCSSSTSRVDGDVFASGESTRKKCEGVADAINKLLQNLVIKCAKEEGVRDYFNVAVIGYGATVARRMEPAAGRELCR